MLFQLKRNGRELKTKMGFLLSKSWILEALTECEQGNTYYIFPLGKDGDKKEGNFTIDSL